MKTNLNLVFLAAAGGLGAAEIAVNASVRLASLLNAGNAVAALGAALVVAMFIHDYTKAPRRLMAVAACADAPAVAATADETRTRVRRSAYTIRRGEEAARLATPPAVAAFRRTPRVRYERAA